jgi:hypothetical protein
MRETGFMLVPMRGGFRRRLGHMLLAGAGALALAPDAPADAATQTGDDSSPFDRDDDDAIDDTIDIIEAAVVSSEPHVASAWLCDLLQALDRFDATHTAALAALSPHASVRRAVGDALARPFPLVGDDFVLDQLARDADPDVRAAAGRALAVRRSIRG